MKVQLTTASSIAEASMHLTWKENLVLFLSLALPPVFIIIAFVIVPVVVLSAILGLVTTIHFTYLAVMAWAQHITYLGTFATAVGTFWLMIHFADQRPRNMFIWFAKAVSCFAAAVAIGHVFATASVLLGGTIDNGVGAFAIVTMLLSLLLAIWGLSNLKTKASRNTTNSKQI